MIYRYRAGHAIAKLDAQTIGDTLTGIGEAHGGRIVPAVVVAESRPEEAPLHDGFTWDDAEAAESWREDEARRMIRSYVIVRDEGRGVEREELANVSVAGGFDEDGAAYMPARVAMQDPTTRARILSLARAQLNGWVSRYAHLDEMGGLVRAVQQAIDEHPEAPPPRPEARPARARRPRRRPPEDRPRAVAP